MMRGMMVRLRAYFVSGLFAVIPLGLSLLVVLWIVQVVDRSLAPVVTAFLGWDIPGLGLVSALVLIVGAGVLTSYVVGERLLEVAEGVFYRIPVFKSVYGTVKQMVDAFSPENKASFKSVVMVEYQRAGVYSMGFVTNETVLDLPDGTQKTLLSVYIPTNHVYFGDIALLPKEAVIPTQLSVQQGIQCSLSAGAAIPGRLGPTAPRAGTV